MLMLYRLDGKHVVFGQVIDGFDLVKEMEGLGNPNGETKAKVIIEDCGVIH